MSPLAPLRTEPPPDASDMLRLQQLVSPSFPIGAFAYSQGLEAAIVRGAVRDLPGVAAWVAAVLSQGSGRTDAILLALARRPFCDPQRLDALARALAPSAERSVETLEQGRAFAMLASVLLGRPVPAMALPVAVGCATASLRIPTAQVLTLWLHGLAAQLVSAAVRFLPLGQTEGQLVLHGLAPRIVALAQSCAAAGLEDIATFTPGADLAAMEHETLDVRLFRS